MQQRHWHRRGGTAGPGYIPVPTSVLRHEPRLRHNDPCSVLKRTSGPRRYSATRAGPVALLKAKRVCAEIHERWMILPEAAQTNLELKH